MPALTGNASQLNTQAIQLASSGDYKEAIACFKKALSIETDNYLLWYNLGVTYRDSGDLLMAKESLIKAFSIEDDDDEVIESLALIDFNIGLNSEAMDFCKMGLERNAANAHLWNTLGVIYFNMQIYDKAAESFEQAVSIDPFYYDALYNLRDTYEETGNKTGAAICREQMKNIKNRGPLNA